MQAHLVCSFPLDAIPCEEAPNFYEGPESINARFGEKVSDDDYEAAEYYWLVELSTNLREASQCPCYY